MPKKLTDDDLRHWLRLEFTVEQMAQMARPLSAADIQARLDALTETERKQQQKVHAATVQEAQRLARQHERARIAASMRPQPPQTLLAQDAEDKPLFAPAPDLLAWLYATIIAPGGLLHNPDHAHLEDAHVGILWTNVGNSRGGNAVVGTAEKPMTQGGKWQKARGDYQMTEWFGEVPDFLITLDALYAAECDDLSLCALLEHECYHCGQAVDAFGSPKFSKATGLPVYCIRGHDVEEFVPIIRLYGVEGGAGQTRAFIEAAQHPPTHGVARIAQACGTCKR